MIGTRFCRKGRGVSYFSRRPMPVIILFGRALICGLAFNLHIHHWSARSLDCKQPRPNKTALNSPLPLPSRSWKVLGNLNQNRRSAPGRRCQASDVHSSQFVHQIGYTKPASLSPTDRYNLILLESLGQNSASFISFFEFYCGTSAG